MPPTLVGAGQPTGQSCANCRFWLVSGKTPSSRGECRRFPPLPASFRLVSGIPFAEGASLVTVPDYWCGEWRDAGGPSLDEQRIEEIAQHVGAEAEKLRRAVAADTQSGRMVEELVRGSKPFIGGSSMAVQSIDDLVASVAAMDTVVDSAVTLISGFSGRLQQAITDALQGGATKEELAPLTALKTDIDAKARALADAVKANTPTP